MLGRQTKCKKETQNAQSWKERKKVRREERKAKRKEEYRKKGKRLEGSKVKES